MNSNAHFEAIAAAVAHLKAGGKLSVDPSELSSGCGGALAEFLSNGFRPADRVLEGIVGSSYTHGWRHAPPHYRLIEFFRVHCELPDGIRSYVSPDRIHFFKRRQDGLYQHPEAALTMEDQCKLICCLHGHQWREAWVMPPPSDLVPIHENMAVSVQMVKGKSCMNCSEQQRDD